jgi:hypothetical protein
MAGPTELSRRPLRIAVTGASGLIGRALCAAAAARGHRVVGFSRSPEKAVPCCAEMRRFSAERPPDLAGCDAVVHLAGESVVGLWTAEKMRRIRESRIGGTRRVAEAVAAAKGAVAVFVAGSAVGFYGDTGDRPADESAPAGEGFLAAVAADWEAAARAAEGDVGRIVFLRTSVVLAREGGALAAMLPPFRFGLGARLGSGKQWMAWIHLEDEVGLILHALETPGLSGPLNAAAPEPATNVAFTRALARAVRRPAPCVAPAWLLRAALGGFAAELLESRRVVPAAALASGFRFRHPDLGAALGGLCAAGD